MQEPDSPQPDPSPAGTPPPSGSVASRWRRRLGLAGVAAAVLTAGVAFTLTQFGGEVVVGISEAVIRAVARPPGGLLFIEPPQVYTRERLVNDRFAQANWLDRELSSTESETAAQLAAAASRATRRASSTSLGMGGADTSTAVASPPKGGEPEAKAAASQASAQLDQAELFGRRLSYRSTLRSELMDTQLDDSHDLDGTTLYRFNFDTVVMPWVDVRTYPGSAVFLIEAHSTRPEEGASAAAVLEEAKDDLELLQMWQRDIQQFFTRVVKFRLDTFGQMGMAENKTDPQEDGYFDLYLRRNLFDSYADLMSEILVRSCARAIKSRSSDTGAGTPVGADNKAKIKDRKGSAICTSPETAGLWLGSNDQFDNKKKRRKQIAGWLDIEYADNTLSYTSAMQARFRDALEVAHEVNAIHWPRVDNKLSFRASCVDGLAKAPAAASLDVSAQIDEDCLIAYSDPGYKRAMIRLIYVMQAMLRKLRSSTPQDFTIDFRNDDTDFKAPFLRLSEAFKIRPDPGDLKTLAKEIGTIRNHRNNGQRLQTMPLLQMLEQRCDKPGEGKDITALMTYGRCRFQRSNSWFPADIIAGFIHERIINTETAIGESRYPVTRFVDVELTGCNVSGCRIEVRRKERDDVGCYEHMCWLTKNTRDALVNACNELNGRFWSGPEPAAAHDPEAIERRTKTFKWAFSECVTARELRDWLEGRSYGIDVYEVSPHTLGRVAATEDSQKINGAAGWVAWNVGFGASRSQEAAQGITRVDTTVIGFGNGRARRADRPPLFGWVIRPEKNDDGGWIASHNRLSAVLSVPAWWRRVEFRVIACWVSPAQARALGEEPLNSAPAMACKGQKTLERDFEAKLPRRTEEVTDRFRFDFIKAPYLDEQWLATSPKLRLEAGKPGKLAILGARLWRGTVVTVMGQPADKITVLPDMKGVVAEFECVARPPEFEPPPKPAGSPEAGAAKGPPADAAPPVVAAPPNGAPPSRRRIMPVAPPYAMQELTVWTSEGRTQSTSVEVYPFSGAQKGERPCQPSERRFVQGEAGRGQEEAPR